MKPRAGNAGRFLKPDQILHATVTAIPCASLLLVLASYALTLLTLRPLEMLCGAVIVWRSNRGR